MLSGFHEASYRHAVRMRPWGSPLANDNPRKDARPPSDPGPNYVIMSTRGRPTHATSAADIAVPSDAVITSPVDGTVIEATPYALYGTYPDNRIRIRPTHRPDLVVTVLHVTGPRVAVGDTVTAGETPIAASATDFPFPSHVDAYSGGHPPHVHIEVKRGRIRQ
jgi:biotin carboxyl carrier protein